MIKAQDDVDILAFDKTGKKVLLCECKFRNKPMPMEEMMTWLWLQKCLKMQRKSILCFSASLVSQSQ